MGYFFTPKSAPCESSEQTCAPWWGFFFESNNNMKQPASSFVGIWICTWEDETRRTWASEGRQDGKYVKMDTICNSNAKRPCANSFPTRMRPKVEGISPPQSGDRAKDKRMLWGTVGCNQQWFSLDVVLAEAFGMDLQILLAFCTHPIPLILNVDSPY